MDQRIWGTFRGRRRRRLGRMIGFVAMGLGWGLAGGSWWATQSPAHLPRVIPLSATGSSVTDRLAVATGPVDDEVEGLFVLDFATGELQCLVMNVRTAKFGGVFRTNVLQDMGAVPRKNAQFALTTGEASFARAGRVARVSQSVAYVVDPTTGRYAAYSLSWRPEIAASGRGQGGNLELLDSGQLTAPVAVAP